LTKNLLGMKPGIPRNANITIIKTQPDIKILAYFSLCNMPMKF